MIWGDVVLSEVGNAGNNYNGWGVYPNPKATAALALLMGYAAPADLVTVRTDELLYGSGTQSVSGIRFVQTVNDFSWMQSHGGYMALVLHNGVAKMVIRTGLTGQEGVGRDGRFLGAYFSQYFKNDAAALALVDALKRKNVLMYGARVQLERAVNQYPIRLQAMTVFKALTRLKAANAALDAATKTKQHFDTLTLLNGDQGRYMVLANQWLADATARQAAALAAYQVFV